MLAATHAHPTEDPMTMRMLVLTAALAVSLGPEMVHAQSADAIQKRLETQAAGLSAWTTDAVLLAAVTRQNALGLTLAEIRTRDEAWIAGKAPALISASTTGACADRLRALAGNSLVYGEGILMDGQGALVCATNLTTDYWQGDEAKWTRTFNEGKGAVFIDRPRLDESAGQRLAQISLPILSSGKVVGAITVGVQLDKLQE